MKKMKRGVCLALSVLFCMSMAACNAKQTEKDGDNVTLTWFVPLSNEADSASVMSEVSAITKEKIGASLEVQFIDASAYGERMTMNMASGNSFDLCFTGYVNPYISAVDNGGYLALDDLMKENAPKLLEVIPDYAWEIARVNGQIYAVPNLQGFAPPNSLYFYDDLTSKYNFDTSKIQTVEDVEPFLKSLKENEPSLIPYRYSYGAAMWLGGKYEEVTSGLMIRCDGSSPELELIYDTPEYKRAIEKQHEWFTKGYIRSDLISVGSDTQDLNAGKYGVNQSGWLPGAEETAKQSTGRDVTIVPVMKPYLAKDKGLAAMTAVGLKSKHPDKAIRLLELVNTDKEVYNLLAFGIRDKHYKMNEDNKISIIEGSGYTHNSAWIFGNQFNALLTEGQDDSVWEETDKLNREAVKSPILGFVLDTKPIKSEISQVAAVRAEFTEKSIVVDGFAKREEMMNKLKAAGIDKVKEEVQRQINEYWSQNH